MFVTLVKEWKGKPPGEKIDVPDDYAPFLIDSGTAKACADDPAQALVAQAVSTAAAGLSKRLDEIMSQALKQFADAAGKSRRHAVPAIFGEGQRGDPSKTFGAFLLAVRTGDQKAIEDMGGRFVQWDGAGQKSTLVTQTGSLGGFAVPDQFYGEIMALAAEKAIVRPRAFVIEQSARTTHIPLLDQAPYHGAQRGHRDFARLAGEIAGWPWVITHPGLPQIRTCPIQAYGSSPHGLATHGTPSGPPPPAAAGTAAISR